jgi:hypothetical protein
MTVSLIGASSVTGVKPDVVAVYHCCLNQRKRRNSCKVISSAIVMEVAPVGALVLRLFDEIPLPNLPRARCSFP